MEINQNDNYTLAEAADRTNGRIIFSEGFINEVGKRKGYETILDTQEFIQFMNNLGIRTIKFEITDSKPELLVSNFNHKGEALSSRTKKSDKRRWKKENEDKPTYIGNWSFDLVIRIDKSILEKNISYRDVSDFNQASSILLDGLLSNVNNEILKQIAYSSLNFNFVPTDYSIISLIVFALTIYGIGTIYNDPPFIGATIGLYLLEFRNYIKNKTNTTRLSILIPNILPISPTLIGIYQMYSSDLLQSREIQEQIEQLKIQDDLEG